ncbi:hypothetical protein AVEN_78421-1 [Araneus ventricosus]|uniref:Uncharacterized protein n=1 Tax=Araneus ventricosus TaxID=182803 RepID=A0A4Y2TJQ1_ARAVE|nr:hypothetical protein AVEN_78421-1 [Araneus ventricosus]
MGREFCRGEDILECARYFHVTSRSVGKDYIRTVLGSQWDDRLEGLESFPYSASWTAGELSAIESAVTVITRELLTVCVGVHGNDSRRIFRINPPPRDISIDTSFLKQVSMEMTRGEYSE